MLRRITQITSTGSPPLLSDLDILCEMEHEGPKRLPPNLCGSECSSRVREMLVSHPWQILTSTNIGSESDPKRKCMCMQASHGNSKCLIPPPPPPPLSLSLCLSPSLHSPQHLTPATLFLDSSIPLCSFISLSSFFLVH